VNAGAAPGAPHWRYLVLVRFLAVPSLVCAGVLALAAAPAWGQNQLFQDYRSDGVINPCDYSRGQLRQGLQGLPPDVQQYAPGFADQLRRNSTCGGGGSGGGQSAASQEDDQAAAAAGGGGPGRRGRDGARISRPPAPKADSRPTLDGVAPAVSIEPKGSQVPDWLVALLAGLAASGLTAMLAVRYGVLRGGLARPLRASFSDLGARLRPGR
jgi:hypothetical protein